MSMPVTFIEPDVRQQGFSYKHVIFLVRADLFPSFPSFLHQPASSNVSPRHTYDFLPFFWLCDWPDFCPSLLRGSVGPCMSFKYLMLDPFSIADGLDQILNTLNENPCTVVAYSASICNEGGECSYVGRGPLDLWLDFH
jgi:hypothetical protein